MTIKTNTFAEACFNNNSIDELKAALKADYDETDVKTWGLTPAEYYSELKSALNEKFNLENLNMQYVASNEYNEQIENGAILECSKSWTINSLQTWLPDCDFDTLESVKNWLSGESYIAEGMYLKVWF